jgi:hypothetical protein
MTRRLFTLASVVSLVICVGIVVLWIRSYWRHDHAALLFGRSIIAVESDMGLVAFVQTTSTGSDPLPKPRLDCESNEASFNLIWIPPQGGQFSRERQWFVSRRATAVLESWAAPFWFLAIITITFPASTMAWKRISRHVDARGRCACGYDLRASTERCPECGAPITSSEKEAIL